MQQSPVLRPGTKMVWDGRTCTIVGFDGPCVQLRSTAGERMALLLSGLATDPGFRVLDSPAVHSTDRPAPYLDTLPHDVRENAEALLGHLHEAWTGYKSGMPLRP